MVLFLIRKDSNQTAYHKQTYAHVRHKKQKFT